MTNIIFSSIINDLKIASKKNDHAFRYFTLATSDIDGTPRARTVVLRGIDDDLNLTFYTDKRSKKITQMNDQNKVSLLFFDPKRRVQISIQAKAEIITEDAILKNLWNQIPEKSRKEYTAQQIPGKNISDPNTIDFFEHKHFFSAIRMVPRQIEFLRLQQPNHIRVLFKKEIGHWQGTYLVP